jgi:hypothetical protein
MKASETPGYPMRILRAKKKLVPAMTVKGGAGMYRVI